MTSSILKSFTNSPEFLAWRISILEYANQKKVLHLILSAKNYKLLTGKDPKILLLPGSHPAAPKLTDDITTAEIKKFKYTKWLADKAAYEHQEIQCLLSHKALQPALQSNLQRCQQYD